MTVGIVPRVLNRDLEAPGAIGDTRSPGAEAGTGSLVRVGAAIAIATVALSLWLWEIPALEATLCLLQVALAAGGFAKALYPVRLTAMVAFGFSLSWLGVAPIYQISHHAAAWGDDSIVRSSDVVLALVLNVLFTGALLVGFYLRPSSKPPALERDSGWMLGRLLPALYLLGCLALTPRALAANGGLSGMFSSRSSRSEFRAGEGLTTEQAGGLAVALISHLPTALAVASAYLLLVRLRVQAPARGGWSRVLLVDGVLFALALGLVAIFANPFSSTRAIAATAIAPLIILLLQPRSRRAGRYVAAVVVLATFLAYPVANIFRGAEAGTDSGFAVLATEDFDGFQQVVNSIDFARDEGHSLGHYLLSAGLYFVPRSMWEGKADPASIDVATHRGYWFTNLSLPFHAEMFVEFGIVGMVLVVFLVARLGRRMDVAWQAAPLSSAGLLAPYAAVASLLVIRGPLGSLAPVFLTTAGLILLGVRRRPAPSVTAG